MFFYIVSTALLTAIWRGCYQNYFEIKMETNSSKNDYFRHDILFAHRHTSFYIILSFENIIGLVGNSLFLLSFIKAKNCTSNMYAIMKSLSVIDLLSSFSFIINPIQEIFVKDYTIQHEVCRYHSYLKLFSFLNNILHLLLLGIDRYVAISRPHR